MALDYIHILPLISTYLGIGCSPKLWVGYQHIILIMTNHNLVKKSIPFHQFPLVSKAYI